MHKYSHPFSIFQIGFEGFDMFNFAVALVSLIGLDFIETAWVEDFVQKRLSQPT
jgi:hypothetical protein